MFLKVLFASLGVLIIKKNPFNTIESLLFCTFTFNLPRYWKKWDYGHPNIFDTDIILKCWWYTTLFSFIQIIHNSLLKDFTSVHLIFSGSCINMLTNNRNIEWKTPTDQLGRHVLMTEIYPTVLLGLPGHRWISKSLYFFNDVVVVSKFGNGFKIIINCCELFRDV